MLPAVCTYRPTHADSGNFSTSPISVTVSSSIVKLTINLSETGSLKKTCSQLFYSNFTTLTNKLHRVTWSVQQLCCELDDHRTSVWFPAEVEIFLFITTSRPTLGPGCLQGSFLRNNTARVRSCPLNPSSAEGQECMKLYHTPQYMFMGQYLSTGPTLLLPLPHSRVHHKMLQSIQLAKHSLPWMELKSLLLSSHSWHHFTPLTPHFFIIHVNIIFDLCLHRSIVISPIHPFLSEWW